MTLVEELRKAAVELRRRSIPLADLIPMLTRAADAIDEARDAAVTLSLKLGTCEERTRQLEERA